MFNRCAVNALLGWLGRMRKVKRDNRNEEKGHFRRPAPGTDVITAAYRLVRRSFGGSAVGGAVNQRRAVRGCGWGGTDSQVGLTDMQ